LVRDIGGAKHRVYKLISKEVYCESEHNKILEEKETCVTRILY
jgi:hypothetical protein